MVHEIVKKDDKWDIMDGQIICSTHDTELEAQEELKKLKIDDEIFECIKESIWKLEDNLRNKYNIDTKTSRDIITTYVKEFVESREEVETCPICDSENVHDATDVIIEEARDATVLMLCEDCQFMWGRFT
jgi:hypothetical protein